MMSSPFSHRLLAANMTLSISVQQADFNLADEYASLSTNASCGAVVIFTGLVRELANGTLKAMTLEHYPGMTERALQDIAKQAQQRWQLGGVRIIHRVGTLLPNEQIVFVGVTSPHRVAAFEATQFIMDYLKNTAPFWKKEHTTEQEYWVAAKASDQAAIKRW